MIPGGILEWSRNWAEWSGPPYDGSFRAAILCALSEARSRGHGHIGVEHLVAGAVSSHPGAWEALARLHEPLEVVQRSMELTSDPHRDPDPEAPIDMSAGVEEVWEKVERAHRRGTRLPPAITPRAAMVLGRAAHLGEPGRVRMIHVLLAAVEEPNSVVASVLRELGVPRARVDAWVRARLEWGPLLDLAREAGEQDPPG